MQKENALRTIFVVVVVVVVGKQVKMKVSFSITLVNQIKRLKVKLPL
jgi:hypothetical protein